MTGLTLSQYRIQAELGRGGMGIVYRATDTKLNRTVALKVLPASALASEDDRARFFREAQAAAQLHHPNIATVFQIDEAIPVDDDGTQVGATDGPRPFIAMEFVEGETIADLIKKAPFPLSQSVSIAGQVAEALKEAHGKDIVHRDIKSANVMLTADGVAKVLDFGLAKTNQSTMLTRMGSTLGTVAYMSPEQARGQEVDGRTDLYALGTMLYEMVAGRLPFAGDYEQAVLYSILNESPEPLTSIRTGVPMDMERVVSKLLSKEAEYRYQSAAGLLADLKSLDLTGSGHSRRSVTAMPTTPKPASKPDIPLWAWGLVAAALLVGAVGAWLAKPAPDTPREPIYLNIDLPGVVDPLAAAWTPDGRSIFYVAHDSVGGRTFVRRHELKTGINAAVEGTAGARSVHISPEGRWLVTFNGELERFERQLVTGGTPSAMPGSETNVNIGAYNDTGDFLFTNRGGDIIRLKEDGSSEVIAMNDTTGHFFVAPVPVPGSDMLYWIAGVTANTPHAGGYFWSGPENPLRIALPQHAVRAFVRNGYALLWPRAGGPLGQPMAVAPIDAERGVLQGSPVPFERMQAGALSFSGNLLYQPLVEAASVSDGESIFRLDTSGARALFGRVPGQSADLGAAWNRNAIVIEARPTSNDPRDLYLFDLDARTATRLTRDGANENADWSPGDDYVYFNRTIEGQPMSIVRRRIDGAGGIESVLADSFANGNPTLSPDGRLMVFTSNRGESSWDLYGYRFETDEQFLITDAQYAQSDAAFSPDGRYLVYRSSSSGPASVIVAPIEGSGDTEVTGDGGFPVWSPDGFIYFRRGSRFIYRVPVTTDPVFRIDGAEELVYETGPFGHVHFDVLANGDLVIAEPAGTVLSDSGAELRIVLNFDLEMERLSPRTK